MKRLIISYVGFLLVGCSSGGGSSGNACDGSLALGTWSDGSSDVMTFEANCSGTSSYCASTFTTAKVSDANGFMTVNVSSTNGNAGCLPTGQTTCEYIISGSNLAFDCGSGPIYYTKQ